MIKLTPGKLAGLKAVSDHRGVIAAAAMDQRGSLQKSLAKEAGTATIPPNALEEFKTLVTSVLTKHASAILLDPEYGLPASKHRNGKGLLLAYEKTGYDAINDHKHAFIERIGDECRAHDIPFFLEFVGYDHKGGDEKSIAYAKAKPDIVSGSMAEFGKEKYGVDVLKVEVPVQMEFVAGTKAYKGETAYTRAEALQHFRDAAGATHKPFIYLSAGVSNAVFIETLELAVESGTNFNGVLCGRATWKDGIKIYASKGAKAFEEWLNTQGVENINNVNKALEKAHSWHQKVDQHATLHEPVHA
jgi:tagatose 1,6-diphosphate aldolase